MILLTNNSRRMADLRRTEKVLTDVTRTWKLLSRFSIIVMASTKRRKRHA